MAPQLLLERPGDVAGARAAAVHAPALQPRSNAARLRPAADDSTWAQ